MSASQGYYNYEYQLSHDNSIIPPHFEPYFQGVDVIYSHTRIEYILKKITAPGQAGDAEERLDSFLGIFQLPWNCINEMDDAIFHGYFLGRGVSDLDVRVGLVRQFKDFANQIKADPINAGCTVFPILLSIQVYTVQQENETIESAMLRAITSVPRLLNRPRHRFNRTPFIKSLKRIKVEVDNLEQDECCICLNKACVGEEISFLKCLHAYHSECIINWLEKSNSCPLCRAPVFSN